MILITALIFGTFSGVLASAGRQIDPILVGNGGPPPCQVQGPWSFQGVRSYFPHVGPGQ